MQKRDQINTIAGEIEATLSSWVNIFLIITRI